MDSDDDDYLEIISSGHSRLPRRSHTPIILTDSDDEADVGDITAARTPDLEADDKDEDGDADLSDIVTPCQATLSIGGRQNERRRTVGTVDVEEWSEQQAALRRQKRGLSEDDEEEAGPSGGLRRHHHENNSPGDEKKKKRDDLVPSYSRYTPDDNPYQTHLRREDLDWLIISQRFVILAVMRWHGCPEQLVKHVITAPYLQIPYERQLGVLRGVAQAIWNGSKCSAGVVYHELVNRPVGALLAIGIGQICTMCHRARQDRTRMHQYHIEGLPYDDDTFGQLEGSMYREYDWQLGTSCWEPITLGHQTYHQMYTTFHRFEAKWISTIESGTRLWTYLQTANIDALVRHFRDERIPEQRIASMTLTEETTVLNHIMDDIALRVRDETTRRVNQVRRMEENMERRRARAAAPWSQLRLEG